MPKQHKPIHCSKHGAYWVVLIGEEFGKDE